MPSGPDWTDVVANDNGDPAWIETLWNQSYGSGGAPPLAVEAVEVVGTTGYFLPAGCAIPTFAELTVNPVAANPATAWQPNSYAPCDDGSASWDGTAWVLLPMTLTAITPTSGPALTPVVMHGTGMRLANFHHVGRQAITNPVKAMDGLSISGEVDPAVAAGVTDVEIDAPVPGNYCVLTGGYTMT